MTFTTYLERVEAANKRVFAASKVQLTPDAIRNLLRTAYDAGHDQGMALAKELGKFDGVSAFEKIFGKH